MLGEGFPMRVAGFLMGLGLSFVSVDLHPELESQGKELASFGKAENIPFPVA